MKRKNPKSSTENIREFDLNIEKILENWENHHAIREIIANALDEQILTNTKEIEIKQTDDGWWHIIDYGRGLNYHHLTQNESEEKLSNDKLIGRFGVGLKDALATLYRHNVKVEIKSKYGIITLKTASKNGFEDILTLHASIAPPCDKNMIGTDFCLHGCSKEDIDKAKALFLRFSKNQVLESTKYGEVLGCYGKNSSIFNNTKSIYINGVKVAEESNFLFSYNITSLNAQIKKALNRERTNVGRTAYTGRIRDILKECKSHDVITELVEDFQKFGSGGRHDELTWGDIALFASMKVAKKKENTTFVTTRDLEETPSLVDKMKIKGYEPVVVPENLVSKMEEYNSTAKEEDALPTVDQYVKVEQEKFSPTEIEIEKLTKSERRIYDKTDEILKLIGGKPEYVKKIVIVDKIYESELYYETTGIWHISGVIMIKRNQLKSLRDYAGTLLHECAHAISNADDVSRRFETALTEFLGIVASKAIKD